MKALPFISEYKWAAIVVVVILFVLEAILATVRAIVPSSPFPIYVSSVVTFVIEVTLVACYLSAAVAIARRIGKHGKRAVRQMTLRITVSCLGYVICIAALIAFSISYQQVWGRSMTLNTIFIGFNLAGLMQVLALRPAPQHGSSSRNSAGSASMNHLSSKTASHNGKDSAPDPATTEDYGDDDSDEEDEGV